MDIVYVKITDVIVGERFRKAYGDILEVADSIDKNGLLQPITIDDTNRLIAGGRRLSACIELGWTTIPAIIRKNVDDRNLRELELIENVHRKDLEWFEKDALISAIHDMYIEEKGERDWSIRKTANELGVSASGVIRHIELAKAVKQVPELAKASTQDQAVKTLKKLHEKVAIKGVMEKQDTGKAALRTVAAMSHFNVGDAFEGMREIAHQTVVSFIEIDPPYAINLQAMKKNETGAKRSELEEYNEIDEKDYPDFMRAVLSETYRIAGENCWMVLWHGAQWKDILMEILNDTGWQYDLIPAIWNKGAGQTMQPNINLARTYETFIVCRKGKPILAKPGRSNVFTYAPEKPSNKYHPTQRPITLMREILETFSFPDTIIMVPFLGSGATLRAAYEIGRIGFGWDKSKTNKEYFLLAVDRDQTGEPEESPVFDTATEEEMAEMHAEVDAEEAK